MTHSRPLPSLRIAALFGCLFALTLSLPAAAHEAKATLLVTARVVRTAQVDVAVLPSVKPAAPTAVKGGTEWKVPLKASAESSNALPAPRAGVTFQVKDCQGAQAQREAGSLKVFVPQGAQCAPVVVATVYPDGAPPDSEKL
jgi:hypothetical protein